ncbi:MAG TPA: DNA methyltransferase [Roseiarcus sp.]|nr:DNA methyltransferase [Roseiarcus sp.]
MAYRKAKPQAPSTATGVKDTIAARARARRETQRALGEIASQSARARRNDLAPRLCFETRATESLRVASRQVRRRDARQSAKLQASIERFGVCRPILIDAEGTIVEGHGLWEAAKALGVAELPCIVVDHLDQTELRTLRIALNRLGETGAWDPDALRFEFDELIVLGVDLVETGFETAEIDGIMLLDDDEDLGAAETPAPQPPPVAVSRLGDIWVLGEHRLAHGDARDAALYDRLMLDGELAQLVLTDEPYNVANVGHVTSNANHREFAFAHGEMSREQFREFNLAWMSAAKARVIDGGLLATFIDWRSIELVIACGTELGLDLLNVVAWVKTNAGQGSLWRSQHEFLPVFKKGDAPHVNNVELGRHGRWRSNVWEYAGASSLGSDAREGLALHPTVKPRVMLEDALLDVTNRGDIVIDCFAGSGSTLVAAEATDRRCRAVEFDGPYCDVIIRRWSEMTGREAVLEATGETFLQVAERRQGELTPNDGPSEPAPQSDRAEDDVAPDDANDSPDDCERGATPDEEGRQ